MDINTGIIVRQDDGSTLLRMRGKRPDLLETTGVYCENPEAAEEDRVYAKLFPKEKKIYFPHEYKQAAEEELGRGRTKNLWVLGGNGYSAMDQDRLSAWGLAEGAYESACLGLFRWLIRCQYEDFPGIKPAIAHGAGPGIDTVLIDVANEFELPQLGHSCPGYLFYVNAHDGVPVVCMENKEAYAAAFIQSLDALVGCNGGQQAFLQDISLALHYQKHYLPVDIVGAISSGGSLQAVSNGKIVDAVSAVQTYIHFINSQAMPEADDRFVNACLRTSEMMRAITRASGKISHKLAYANIAHQLERRR